LVPVGYVSQPKTDHHNQNFVSAEVLNSGLGITAVYLPCEALRDYFYRMPVANSPNGEPGFYEILCVLTHATPAELRVAFKLRTLELAASGAPRRQLIAVERAFNILARPELRACYDALLADSNVPAIFPYGGSGSLLVSGDRSPDGNMFFAQRILSFSPELRQRRFELPLRHCHFYEDRALCRDVWRKIEFWLDPAVLHTSWDATWNQWKHRLPVKMEVDATFVSQRQYRKRRGEWEFDRWEMALPSRLAVTLPSDFPQQVEHARATHRRFGQYSRALEQIRLRLEYHPIEKTELERLCSKLAIPCDFDISQISWRVDYDPFFYRHLSRQARRIYLFRDEYIFDLQQAAVVETPQLGHATYVFGKPRSMESFLAVYTKTSKDDIRRNRDNVAERLKFLGRVIHGTNPRVWLKDVQQRTGEKIEHATTGAAE
jgi:hypothetical protein